MGSYTLLSRILGFLRDLIIARMFGANIGTDAFWVAFTLPNLTRRLAGEGVFSLAIVPVITANQYHNNYTVLKSFINKLVGTLIAILIPTTVLGILFASYIVTILAPGFVTEPARFALTTTMLQILMPAIACMILTACIGAILHSHQRFQIPAFTPILLNIGIISAAWWLTPYLHQPIIALAWGVLIGSGMQLALQIFALTNLKLLPKPRISFKDPKIQQTIKLLVPALISTAVTHFGLIFDAVLLSFLPIGSVSWLYYAKRLTEFPQGLLGTTIATVLLPQLATLYNSNISQAIPNSALFSKTIDHALQGAFILGIPATIGLWMLATPIISTLFYSDKFTITDINMAAASLKIYALGLPAYLSIKILAPAYYAIQDTKTSTRIALVTGMCHILLGIVLIIPLAHLGLAWASTVAANIYGMLLWRGLIRDRLYKLNSSWMQLVLRVGCASACMGLFIIFGEAISVNWLEFNTIQSIKTLTVYILGSMVIYIVVLFGIGFRLQQIR
ncbi:hypothetical protein TI05_02795 [Achromatium sp. WMS3]|nr:hypothetical protein TI05_02795 [Achromatium sp. WMS3]